MNKQEFDILRTIFEEPFINQGILSETSGHSLGIVNRSLKTLIAEGYLTENIQPTRKAVREYNAKTPKNAIILAAGYAIVIRVWAKTRNPTQQSHCCGACS